MSLGVLGCLWVSLEVFGSLWKSLGVFENSLQLSGYLSHCYISLEVLDARGVTVNPQ